VQEVLLELPIAPVTLGPEPVSFPIELKTLREKVAPFAESATDNLFLELDAEAEHSPGAVWEVYFGLPSGAAPEPEGPYYIGNVVLFGQGIRDEHHNHESFRLNVQTVYDGIIAAVNQAVSAGTLNLGGLTADEWVHAQPAHLCAKVVIRQQGGVFPNFGDTPINNKALAQKNLAPFDINVQDDNLVPNIIWKNFIVGQPFFLKLQGAGANRLSIETQLARDAFKLYVGITQYTYDRFFREDRGGGAIKGFKKLSREELCESKLGDRAKPFPHAVVLRWENKENTIELPAFPEKLYLGMSLGIEYNVKKIKPGNIGEINFVHRCRIPRLVAGTKCFEIEDIVAGGFTILVRANDPSKGPKGRERVSRR